jgi:hypothetical protein
VRGGLISAGAAIRTAVGIAHADHGGRDTATEMLNVRNDVSPQIRRCRVAVQEDDRIAPGNGGELDAGARRSLAVQDGARSPGCTATAMTRSASRGLYSYASSGNKFIAPSAGASKRRAHAQA